MPFSEKKIRTDNLYLHNNLQLYFDNIGNNNKTIYILNEIVLTQNTTQPSNITIDFVDKGKIVTNGYTYTCNGFHNDSLNQIWDTSDGGSVLYGNKMPYIRPEWWGNTKGTLINAINSMPSTGGSIQLTKTDYNIVDLYYCSNTPGAAIGNENSNVKIFGSGMPEKSSNGTRFISGSGTVIQGALINFADGFECYNLGIDCGSYVVDNLSENTWLDGLIAGTHKLNSEWNDYESYIQNVSFDNIKILMKRGATLYGHGCLIEHINGCNHGYVEIDGGYHGYVVKSLNVKGETVVAYGQELDHYFIKSDQYTQARNIIVDKIVMGSLNESNPGTIGGLQALDNVTVEDVTINSLQAYNTSSVIIDFEGTNAEIKNVIVNNISAHYIAGNVVSIGNYFKTVVIGSHIIDTCAIGVIVSAGAENITIGDGIVKGATQYGYSFQSNTVMHGVIQAVDCGIGVHRTGDVVINRERINGSIGSMYVLPITLLNSWVDNGSTSNMDFQCVMEGARLYIKGSIKNGTATTAFVLPSGYRPSKQLSFLTYAITSAFARTFAHIDIAHDGTVYVSNQSDLGTTSIVHFNISFEI